MVYSVSGHHRAPFASLAYTEAFVGTREEEEEEEEEMSLSAKAWGCWLSDSLWVGPPVSRAP